jgi:hypothetical protein
MGPLTSVAAAFVLLMLRINTNAKINTSIPMYTNALFPKARPKLRSFTLSVSIARHLDKRYKEFPPEPYGLDVVGIMALSLT